MNEPLQPDSALEKPTPSSGESRLAWAFVAAAILALLLLCAALVVVAAWRGS